jgi:hypothetical protein
MLTLGWLSTSVVKILLLRVGMTVLRSTTLVMIPPEQVVSACMQTKDNYGVFIIPAPMKKL